MFWQFTNSDPYRALSYDRLHASNLGMFGDHLWDDVTEKLKAKGRQVIKRVDDQ